MQRPEIQVRPDTARAAALGVTAQALDDAMRLATYGDYSNSLPKLNLPERQIAIRVRMDPSVRENIEAIAQLRVKGNEGIVDLGSVADIAMGSGPSQIDRMDRSRNITLSVELNGRAIGEVQKEAMALPALKSLPAGVHQVEQGEVQRMSELFQSFGIAMAIVVIGGLLTSTALSLLVVPVIFTYVDDLLQWERGLVSRRGAERAQATRPAVSG
ncbi:efflux RND transporter permease subunit [Variovorax paradoxus]|uniref:efflux RND transporter permease subunit n=1 Tax=Variovorax paradoxus TaxID=34073 RepID=UPI003D6570D1